MIPEELINEQKKTRFALFVCTAIIVATIALAVAWFHANGINLHVIYEQNLPGVLS